MMVAVGKGECDVVLVESTDRASRKPADMHAIADELEECNVAFFTLAGPVTDMELSFKAVANSQYSKQTIEKVKRGQRYVINSGRVSGSITYGHRKVHQFDERGVPINGLRELHPENSAVVKRIFRDYDLGVSTIAICRALNNEGVPSPKGKQWRPGVLTGSGPAAQGILRNRHHIGEFHFGRTQRKRRHGKIRIRPTQESTWMVNHHPELAIIDGDGRRRPTEAIEFRQGKVQLKWS